MLILRHDSQWARRPRDKDASSGAGTLRSEHISDTATIANSASLS